MKQMTTKGMMTYALDAYTIRVIPERNWTKYSKQVLRLRPMTSSSCRMSLPSLLRMRPTGTLLKKLV
jgi:hypothetical protein